MKIYLLPSDNLFDFVLKLAEDGSVFYPKLEDRATHLVRFDKDKKFEPDFTHIRTAETVKHILFPSRDVVATFPKDEKRKGEKQFLLGVKACDLRGVEVYDRVFLKTDPVDPFYRLKRENTLIISADCPEPDDYCFCNLVGLHPYGETVCDINITEVSNGFVFEPVSPQGEKLVQAHAKLFEEASADDLKEREKLRREAQKTLGKVNEKEFSKDLPDRVESSDRRTMHKARENCVECYGCLHCCPTCYCFLLSDFKKAKTVERVRTWDACYYPAYARVGGGANPRSNLDERFWNRFNCKFNYFHKYEGIYACAGCGRCYRGCSGKIDIREILWQW
ncbi:MAG: 4Fe-4S dicluster domain-containing protein [candidate division WOR-3 bacterium]|nr:MAG: 4Fe-4S dicluster domain-containing protein [candidate division WOR-3 bacterium]